MEDLSLQGRVEGLRERVFGTRPDGTLTRSPLKPQRQAGAVSEPRAEETPEQRIGRLEARVAELEASEKKLATEREILRSAAKYFAGETNW